MQPMNRGYGGGSSGLLDSLDGRIWKVKNLVSTSYFYADSKSAQKISTNHQRALSQIESIINEAEMHSIKYKKGKRKVHDFSDSESMKKLNELGEAIGLLVLPQYIDAVRKHPSLTCGIQFLGTVDFRQFEPYPREL